MTATPTAPTSVALHETTIDGQRMIFVGPSILIHSTSSDAWYIYESGRCSCPGYTHHGHCRHTAPAQRLEEQDRTAAESSVWKDITAETEQPGGWHREPAGFLPGYHPNLRSHLEPAPARMVEYVCSVCGVDATADEWSYPAGWCGHVDRVTGRNDGSVVCPACNPTAIPRGFVR